MLLRMETMSEGIRIRRPAGQIQNCRQQHDTVDSEAAEKYIFTAKIHQ